MASPLFILIINYNQQIKTCKHCVKRFAANGVNLTIYKVKVPRHGNLESQARKIRYETLTNHATTPILVLIMPMICPKPRSCVCFKAATQRYPTRCKNTPDKRSFIFTTSAKYHKVPNYRLRQRTSTALA